MPHATRPLSAPTTPTPPLRRRFLAPRAGRPSPVRPGTAQLVERSAWRGIWRLYWPLALTMVLQVVVGLADTWIAGQLSAAAQAIVGLTLQVIFLINTVTIAVSVGTHALIARLVGSQSWDEAALAARQSILLTALMSVALVLPLVAAAPWLFEALKLPAAVQAEGLAYLRWIFVGILPMNVGIVLSSILKGRGLMTSQLSTAVVEAAVWLALSVLLGYVAGWGLTGLALGFVGGKLAKCAMAWQAFRASGLDQGPGWRLDLDWQKRILRVGLPSGLQSLVRNVNGLAFYGILGFLTFSTDVVAAYTIGFRLESAAFLMVFALSIVATTMVGQHVGAGRPEQAAKAVWRLTRLALGLTGLLGLATYMLADTLAGLFTSDPLVWNYAGDYMRTAALVMPFLAVSVVLCGALQGAGETKPPLLFALTGHTLVGLPLAYGLAVGAGWGPIGAWWGLAASVIVQAALAAWWWRRGTWRTRAI